MDKGIQGICLDLWNTIATTRHDPHPLAVLAEAFGLDERAGWRRILEEAMMTRPLSGITEGLDAIQRVTGRSPAGRWSRRDLVLLWGAACNRNELFSDVRPALARLRRRYRIGIISNTQSFDLDVLRREGLPALVDDILLSSECGLLKPDPAMYHLAARRLGLAPSSLVMVGDSLADDVRGARAAGLRAIWLRRDPCAADAAADPGEAAAHDLTEVADRLERGEAFIGLS
jgi:FMN phosphatase YigB (HAD superfamily)